MVVDGNAFGTQAGWEKVSRVMRKKLKVWGGYDFGYPVNAWSVASFKKEVGLLEECGAEVHAVKDQPYRINYHVTPEIALKVFRKAWFAGDYPEPDASSDEGTLYGFITSVLTTFDIELV